MNNLTSYVKFFNLTDVNSFFININNYENFCKVEENHKTFKKNWSTYKLQYPVFKKIIKMNVIKDEEYILCIFYKNNKNKFDIQFGTSETAKYNETYINTLKRCLGEELGLNILEKNINYNFHNFNFKNKNVNLWAINIENLKKNKEVKDENINVDNRNNKTYCIIYGNENNILEYLKDDIILDKSEDNIKGIIAFKLKDIKKII
jgi:hypothetical protein